MSEPKWEIEGNIIAGAAAGKYGHQVNVVVDNSAFRCVRCQHTEKVEICPNCRNPWFTGGYNKNGEVALICSSCRLGESRWLCPKCGTNNSIETAFGKLKSGPCFIATAAFENVQTPEVAFLRNFRDHTLTKSSSGRSFISAYQKFSPPLANTIARSQTIKRLFRSIIRLIIKCLPRQKSERK